MFRVLDFTDKLKCCNFVVRKVQSLIFSFKRANSPLISNGNEKSCERRGKGVPVTSSLISLANYFRVQNVIVNLILTRIYCKDLILHCCTIALNLFFLPEQSII